MDSFEVNKILGAVLATLLVVMSLGIVSEFIFEREAPEEPGYAIAVATPEHGEVGAGGSEAAPEAVPIAVLLQDADPEAGAKAARKCQACHTFEKGGPARVGPNLWGIVGGPMAHMDGFNYSDAMMAMRSANDTWTFEKLNEFLANPKGAIPGTAMSFAGLKRDKERADVIAYLRTLSDNPVPLPEAAAKEAMTTPEPAAATPTEGGAMGEPQGGAMAPATEGTMGSSGSMMAPGTDGTAPAGAMDSQAGSMMAPPPAEAMSPTEPMAPAAPQMAPAEPSVTTEQSR